jgi:glycosyltransferase involved in cell wall biosynthesis
MTENRNDKKIKICIVTISLSKGGAERSTALLSKMLHSTGFEVHLVTLNDTIDYPFAGNLINLGLNKPKKESFFSRFLRFKKFKSIIKNENFDYIIDNRNRQFALKELFYLYYLYKGNNILYVVRSFKLSQYFPDTSYVRKKMINTCKGIIGVSKAISTTINNSYHTNKAIAIYNPIAEFDKSNVLPIKDNYILYLGRIEEAVKNLTLLLTAYKNSVLPEYTIKLKILGDGPDKNWLMQKIKDLELVELVEVLSFTPNVYPYLKNAKFLTLTSRYEGFPRVLIESLSAGTPVISVDCESGPNEIIKHEDNGLLIENFDGAKLSKAYNRFVLEEELYLHCKQNAEKSIEHLKIENIAAQWTNYLKNELP